MEYAIAHFALQKLHILPSVIADMSYEEKVFLYASTQLRVQDERKAAAKVKGG